MTIRRALLGGAVALATMAGAASAATLSLVGGTDGSIPGVSGGTNAALPALFGAGTTTWQGIYGTEVQVNGKARVTYTVLGGEAAYKNSFTANSTTLAKPLGTVFSWAGFGSIVETVLGGPLTFQFDINGGTNGTVANGSNPDTSATNGKSFFASFGDSLARTGSRLYLFLDDGLTDDNHDDMVVMVDVASVPLPATGLMLVAGLGALGAARRRKAA